MFTVSRSTPRSPIKRNVSWIAVFLCVASTAAIATTRDEGFREYKIWCDSYYKEDASGQITSLDRTRDLSLKECRWEARQIKTRLKGWRGNMGESMTGCALYCEGLYPKVKFRYD